MERQRIYLDTSVFGGLHDAEFQHYTESLFERIKNSEFEIVLSNITEQELENAPAKIRATIGLLPKNSTIYVKSNIEAAELAKRYIDEGVVGLTSYADCLHIALATIHHIDILVSWNFKHIVNVAKIIGYNSVNISAGYNTIDIRSPREFMTYDN